MTIPTSRPLRIGIDARAAVEVAAGRGRVVRELLRALNDREDPHRYILYARRAWAEGELDDRFTWRAVPSSDPWWHVAAARAANGECDVFLSSNSYLTVWFLRIPAVPIVYDLVTFERTTRPNRRSTVIERLTLGPAVRRSAALIAISDAAGRTVVAHLGARHEPGEPLGEDERASLPPGGFVLAVGTLEPRKNLPRLVEAYRTLDPELQRLHPLVVVGALGWETGPTLTALQSLGDRCTMLGHVSDTALGELYRLSAVFCYPSLGEGFGLPVLEAMAAGAPVVTSNLSSLPEVGGEAAEYVDPFDVASIAHGLARVLGDERRGEVMRRAGIARAGEFSWARFAQQVLEVLQTASTRS
jgi:alpha-1,3-rhamnosyl/mannosyltransferase